MREHVVEPIHEELGCPLLSSMAVRVGDKFLGLGSKHRSCHGRQDRLEYAAQPYVEVVRQVGVADVVVVRRIGGHHHVRIVARSRVGLMGLAFRVGRHILHRLGHPFHLA